VIIRITPRSGPRDVVPTSCLVDQNISLPNMAWNAFDACLRATRPRMIRMRMVGNRLSKLSLYQHAFTLFVAILGASFAMKEWLDVASDLHYAWRQRQAWCIDGRRRDQSLRDATFQVDDFEHDDGSALGSMNCRYPVFVYPCDNGPSLSNCSLSSTSAGPLDDWRLAFRFAGVRCIRPGAVAWSGRACDARAWRCDHGLCDAYQKAAERCMSLMPKEQYSCFYVPDHVPSGIAMKPFEAPVASGIFAAIVTGILLACARGMLVNVMWGICLEGASGTAIVSASLCVASALTLVALLLLLGVGPRGLAVPSAVALAGELRNGSLTNAKPWQASVEAAPWRDLVLIAGCLLIFCQFGLVLGYIFRMILDQRQSKQDIVRELCQPAE